MRKFLNQQNSDTLFDEAMFRKLWEHTYVKLPEADWHREFELR